MKCRSLSCSQNSRNIFFLNFFLTTYLFICFLTNIILIIRILKTSQIVKEMTVSNFIVITKKSYGFATHEQQ